MSGQNKADGTIYDASIGWAIMLAIIAVLIWLFWYFFDTEVRDAIRWIRYMQMHILSFFVDKDYTFMSMFEGRNRTFNWHAVYDSTSSYKSDRLTYDFMVIFSKMTMHIMKPVFPVIFGAMALWCMFKGPGTNYRRRLSLDDLIARQSKNFPIISPFMKFNPSKQPPRPPGAPVPAELPAFAEALGPEEWLAYNEILTKDKNIDENHVRRAFIKQLGGRWKGVNALEPYQQVLLAAFALKASRKRVNADEMLGRLALCWSFKNGFKISKDQGLLREAKKVLKDSALAGNMLKEANKHGFVTTAILRSLAFAREEGGVLAPSQFLWLRAHNRHLWYPLNNLGRQSYHMEALAAMAHYRAERMTQRPIPMPKVEDAVETIIEYMKSHRARPIPKLDYSQSEKRAVKKAV